MPVAQSNMGNPTSEIFNRLLKDRIIILGTDVNDDIANIICAQMLFLEGDDEDKDIWLYINSPGGSRSEEHTSELQSLMRISHAVSRLKNKTMSVGSTLVNH